MANLLQDLYHDKSSIIFILLIFLFLCGGFGRGYGKKFDESLLLIILFIFLIDIF
ncbi:MAG: hypothetical protein GXY88_08770 [Tissierellia bacterium]|nr:hypothetical protein [Tissierellia bacterium]